MHSKALFEIFYHLFTAPQAVSNTYAQVARTQSCANHVQHIERLSRASVMLRATWYEGTVQLLSLTELKSHLFELYFVDWIIKPMKEGRKPEYPEKTPGDTQWLLLLLFPFMQVLCMNFTKECTLSESAVRMGQSSLIYYCQKNWHCLTYLINNKNNRIERGNLRFLQSPHCTANCFQHVPSSGPGAIMPKSHATRRAHITCNLLCATWYEGRAQLLSLTKFKSHLFELLFYWLNH